MICKFRRDWRLSYRNGELIQPLPSPPGRVQCWFASAAERDLFRQLVSVSGIGAASADRTFGHTGTTRFSSGDHHRNTHQAIQAPRCKVAKQLSAFLELRNKLADWRNITGLAATVSPRRFPGNLEDRAT